MIECIVIKVTAQFWKFVNFSKFMLKCWYFYFMYAEIIPLSSKLTKLALKKKKHFEINLPKFILLEMRHY